MRFTIFLWVFTFTAAMQAQRSDFLNNDFQRADNIASNLKGEDLYNLPGLVYSLTASLQTDADKFRALYFWVSHNIKGEYHLMLENNRTRKKLQEDPKALEQWNNGFKKVVFKKLLTDKETLCSGYTYLLKELADLAGIECQIINGYGPIDELNQDDLGIANHSWNAVKLNDKWYLCDATWSAGITDLNTYLFEFNYDDSFFLMEPIEFAKTHWPLDQAWTLLPGNTAPPIFKAAAAKTN